jgi:Restriction endonuclease.
MLTKLASNLEARMDWRQYELEITEHFRECYPAASITFDARLMGKYSGIERQIDLLIEDQTSDFLFRIVIDAKFRGRKIDVNDVESFLGFIKDVEAHTGMMIALEGYTRAALDRAYFDDADVILDILNFENLKEYQGLCAIPYSGNNGVCLEAPLGWIADGTQRQGILASLYARGENFDQAVKKMEWMYINFCKKDETLPDLDAIMKHQERYLSEGLPGRKLTYHDGVRNQICGARTLIRRLEANSDGIMEFTGFVDFPEFVLLCVLFTPKHCEPANLRKLRFVMRGAFPMKIIQKHASSDSEVSAENP